MDLINRIEKRQHAVLSSEVNTGERASFKDYVSVLFKHKGYIFLCYLIVLSMAMFAILLSTPKYSASVKLLITAQKQVEATYYRDIVSYGDQQRVLTQSEIVKSAPVLERVVEALSLDQRSIAYEKKHASFLKRILIDLMLVVHDVSEKYKKVIHKFIAPSDSGIIKQDKHSRQVQRAVAALKKSIKVSPVRSTDLFTISVEDFSPEEAIRMANVISRAYLVFDVKQQLAEVQLKYGQKHQVVQQLQDNIAQLSANLHGERISDIEAIGPASVKIIEQATSDFEPKGISRKMIAVLAFLIATFLGVAGAFMFETTNQTIKSVGDIHRYLDLPVIGSIPKAGILSRNRATLRKWNKFSLMFLQNIVDQIYLLSCAQNFKTMAIAPFERNRELSNIITFLGEMISRQTNKKTLLIDFNFHQPAFNKIYDLRDNKGLVDFICHGIDLDDCIHKVADNLFILPVGGTGKVSESFLHEEKINVLFKNVEENYDCVFVAVADMKEYKDAAKLSSFVDRLIVVIEEGRTRSQILQNLLLQLHLPENCVLGAILNQRTFPVPRFIYKRL